MATPGRRIGTLDILLRGLLALCALRLALDLGFFDPKGDGDRPIPHTVIFLTLLTAFLFASNLYNRLRGRGPRPAADAEGVRRPGPL